MQWQIGEEREVKPGNYVRLAAEHAGWLLWSFETAKGIYAGVNKPAEGKLHPAPLGIEQAFYGEAPYVSLLVHAPEPRVVFRGTHFYSTAKYRVVGDRFMTDVRLMTVIEPHELDGKRIEVIVSSMPTERSYSKVVEDHGFIDMSGTVDVFRMANEMKAK